MDFSSLIFRSTFEEIEFPMAERKDALEETNEIWIFQLYRGPLLEAKPLKIMSHNMATARFEGWSPRQRFQLRDSPNLEAAKLEQVRTMRWKAPSIRSVGSNRLRPIQRKYSNFFILI